MVESLQTDPTKQQNYDYLLFDQAQKIDGDKDYWFRLRGSSPNLFIDAANPLLGMVLRVRSLGQCEHLDKLYQQTTEEIKTIELELTQAGQERAVILAYRYILCSFIDESIMNTSWGANSIWAEHSLLTRFHNETWGGEKVFTILNRLQSSPERYKELLEFIFLCLSLGFKGRYQVIENGREEYERVLTHLYQLLQRLNKNQEQSLIHENNKVVNTKYRLNKQLPVWTIFAVFVVVLVVVFGGYSLLLNTKSMNVITQLSQILH